MKRLLRLVAILVLLVMLVAAGALLLVDSLAKQAIERGGTHALGVETRLEDASIGITSWEFGLGGLAIANPPGFTRPDFLTLRSARLELPLKRLLESRVTIPSLELEGIVLDLERNSQGTSYGVILDHLSRSSSGGGGGGGSSENDSDKVYIVKRLVVRDMRAVVSLVPAGGDLTKLDFAVPEVVVEDLGSDMTMAELCGVIVRVV